jgi:DNA repair photolyase
MGMPFRWTLNPYRGCTHACEYCYARKYQQHLALGTGDEFSSVILVKRNVAAVLGRELSHRLWNREQVAIGTATDPYQPIEGHYRITRGCLERLVEARTPFSVVTKGPLVVRDVDLLVRASTRGTCQVFMSVPTVDEPAWSQLEPGTAPPLQRLRAISQLADAGVDAAVLMTPLVPGFSTSRASIERTLEAIAASGVRCAGAGLARLDPGTREHFFAFLERSFPELLDGYGRLYQRPSPPTAFARDVQRTVNAARIKTARAAPGCEPPSADASKRARQSPARKTAS